MTSITQEVYRVRSGQTVCDSICLANLSRAYKPWAYLWTQTHPHILNCPLPLPNTVRNQLTCMTKSLDTPDRIDVSDEHLGF